MITVLRLGHRRVRDARISTHVGLVARAFGAGKIIYSGEKDEKLIKSVESVVENWGGPFSVAYEKNWRNVIQEFKGDVLNLTMYGEHIDKVVFEIRRSRKDKLIIIGSQKVPKEAYEYATWNVAIGNQPHSELSALCMLLDRLFEGKELKRRFSAARLKIMPQQRGKKVIRLSE